MLDELRDHCRREGSVTVSLRVHPGARTTAVTDILDDGSLKISLRAPAEKGKANEELIRFLAEEFEVPRAHVALISGATGRKKIVKITT